MRTDCKDPGYLDEIMNKAKEEEAENWQTRKAGPQCAQNNCYVSERRAFEMLECLLKSKSDFIFASGKRRSKTYNQAIEVPNC